MLRNVIVPPWASISAQPFLDCRFVIRIDRAVHALPIEEQVVVQTLIRRADRRMLDANYNVHGLAGNGVHRAFQLLKSGQPMLKRGMCLKISPKALLTPIGTMKNAFMVWAVRKS